MGEPRFKYVVDEPPPIASRQVVGCCKKCDGDGGFPATCKKCGGTGLSGFATMLHPPGEGELVAALAFAQSVIKSGEPWTVMCEKIIGAALQKHKGTG